MLEGKSTGRLLAYLRSVTLAYVNRCTGSSISYTSLVILSHTLFATHQQAPMPIPSHLPLFSPSPSPHTPQGSKEGAVTPFTVTAVAEVLGSTFSVEVFENLFGTVSCGLQIGGTYILYCAVLHNTARPVVDFFFYIFLSFIDFEVVLNSTYLLSFLWVNNNNHIATNASSLSLYYVLDEGSPDKILLKKKRSKHQIKEMVFDSTRFKLKYVLGSGSFGVVTYAEYTDEATQVVTSYALKSLSKAAVVETGESTDEQMHDFCVVYERERE